MLTVGAHSVDMIRAPDRQTDRKGEPSKKDLIISREGKSYKALPKEATGI